MDLGLLFFACQLCDLFVEKWCVSIVCLCLFDWLTGLIDLHKNQDLLDLMFLVNARLSSAKRDPLAAMLPVVKTLLFASYHCSWNLLSHLPLERMRSRQVIITQGLPSTVVLSIVKHVSSCKLLDVLEVCAINKQVRQTRPTNPSFVLCRWIT